MNPLILTSEEDLNVGISSLSPFHKRQIKVPNGVLMYCFSGKADIILDLRSHRIVPNTNIIMLPGSILSLQQASHDFKVHYFAYSDEMFKTISFRLPPPFMHFLKENSCYTHTQSNIIDFVKNMMEASVNIYNDTNNRYRTSIAQNLLQIFFLNTYDKVQRLFTSEQIKGNGRKEQLFKKFVNLVHTHCTTQRDVTFYAEQLCISTRYLSAITKRMGHESAKGIIDEALTLELKVALQSTELSLKEIADHFRFPDQSFFGRYFKKHTGMSPKRYREENR